MSWVISIFLRWLDHDVVIGVVQVDVQSAFGTIGGAFCNGLKRLDDFARVSFDDLDLVVSPMLHLSADVGEGVEDAWYTNSIAITFSCENTN